MYKSSSKHYRRILLEHSDDPLNGLANLFDVAMVFAVAILLSLLAHAPLAGKTSTNNPQASQSQPNIEVVQNESTKLTHYRVSQQNLTGNGTRLGVAYQLENGEVVYVPETE